MPLIKAIEKELPLVAELPEEWQKDIALWLSRYVVAYDNSLTKSSEELRSLRDEEIKAFEQRFGLKGNKCSASPIEAGVVKDSTVHAAGLRRRANKRKPPRRATSTVLSTI
jgi:hypothetical protein